MPFIKDLLSYRSISFVGMDKNAGKTEALNYVLKRLHSFSNISVGVTSIGIDGETVDQVTQTSKPKVFIYSGTTFVTSEQLYNRKEIVACITDISKYSSSLGRLVSAKAECFGNVMLSGPTNSVWLKDLILHLQKNNDICLIDGALSRKSFASPSITEAMILSSGAVISASIDKIVSKTSFIYQMTKLPQCNSSLLSKLININQGVYALDEKDEVIDLQIPSMLMLNSYKDKLFSISKRLFVSGMITDKLLELILSKQNVQDYTLITKDFTHIFSNQINTYNFLKRGGKIEYLYPTHLIAITANPVSPLGFKVDNKLMLNKLREKIPVPIYNIRNTND